MSRLAHLLRLLPNSRLDPETKTFLFRYLSGLHHELEASSGDTRASLEDEIEELIEMIDRGRRTALRS